jgi:type III secretion protein C
MIVEYKRSDRRSRERNYLSLWAILFIAVSHLLTIFCVSAAEKPALLTLQKQPAQVYFQALSLLMARPVILSPASKKLEISGQFDLTNPMQALKSFCYDMGLIWYFDGQALYVYRQEELGSTLVRLQQLTVDELVRALHEAELYDEQYPLKARPDARFFYLSGPPKYVQLVTQTASLLDSQRKLAQEEQAGATVGIVRVRYRPILTRSLTLRNEKQTELGLIDTLRALWQDGEPLTIALDDNIKASPLPPPVLDGSLQLARDGESVSLSSSPQMLGQKLWILADSVTNSIILRGDPQQIHEAKMLIQQLDHQRQQVQLSLQIIDVKESEVKRLGIDWSGSFSLGDLSGVINPIGGVEGVTTLVPTLPIMARIHALVEQSQARIISRPMVLTQDNITAYFDNSNSFYIKLEAERVADVKTVTYGTLISVTPRIIATSSQAPKVEMQLTIEDGSRDNQTSRPEDSQISQTRIETVARVPSGESLLIGGYTRSERIDDRNEIPLLGRIPLFGTLFRFEQPRRTNVVRLFLIEPRVLNDANNSVTRLEEWLKRTRRETNREQP